MKDQVLQPFGIVERANARSPRKHTDKPTPSQGLGDSPLRLIKPAERNAPDLTFQMATKQREIGELEARLTTARRELEQLQDLWRTKQGQHSVANKKPESAILRSKRSIANLIRNADASKFSFREFLDQMQRDEAELDEMKNESDNSDSFNELDEPTSIYINSDYTSTKLR